MKCREELLALSASGLLDAAEERQVREHARECANCAAQLEEFAELAMAMRQLPSPVPPAYLASRVAREMAEYADRRNGALCAGGAAVLAWAIGLAGWYGLRQVGSAAAMVWLVWSIGSALMAVPVTAGLLQRRRRAA